MGQQRRLLRGFGIAVMAIAARAEAQPFPQGPCGGILCSFQLERGVTQEQIDAAAKAGPQNCGGLMCDLGVRAFPPKAEAQAAPPPEPPPAAPPPVKVKPAKRKHVAKTEKSLVPPADAAAH